MQKITEITETRFKTVREKDLSGKRISKQVSYQAYRSVNVISGGRRFAHAFADGIVYYVIYFLFEYIFIIASVNNSPTDRIVGGFFVSVLFMFLFPLYYMVFEHFFQRSPGKFLTKAIVIDIYGNKPDLNTNVLRNIIRLVPFESLSCLNERGWHDKWSDTYVVSEEEHVKLKELLKAQSGEEKVENLSEDKSVNKGKKVRNIFVYIILPVCLIAYVAIFYKGCKDSDKLMESLAKANKARIDSINKSNNQGK